MKRYIVCLIAGLTLSFSLYSQKKILFLHTNDTHSQIEPVSSAYADGAQGGILHRIALVEKIKKESSDPVFVFDAGDFSQGTPYYNFFKGRVEVALMNRVGYDAVGFGNHEFDNTMDTLAAVLQEANFPVLCSNIDFSQTPLKDKVLRYLILEKNGVRVGIFALAPPLEGLVPYKKYQGAVWSEPIEVAKEMVKFLSDRSDIVVCLSHLGNKKSPSDKELAQKTKGIDLIIGGHSHQLISPPVATGHEDGSVTYMQQMGSKGLYVGKIAVELEQKSCR